MSALGPYTQRFSGNKRTWNQRGSSYGSFYVRPGRNQNARIGYANNRGSRSGRMGGRYRDPFARLNTHTRPVYPIPETKFKTFTNGDLTAPISITSTGLINVINTLAQGTGQQQRIGLQVATKSVYFQMVLNFGTGAVPNAIRHMLV